tara:strand:+ start:1772 stop:2269 length:498 start_codon:yes stop_codon:yes gene_type:complete
MTPERDSVIKVGGLIVDEDSGEIIDLPAGVDSLEHLTMLAVEAKQQAKEWDVLDKLYRRVLLGLLDGSDRDEATNINGQARVRSRKNRKVPAQNVRVAQTELELPSAQVDAIFSCAKTLDPDLLEARAEAGDFPEDALDFLIERSDSRWCEVKPLRLPAPEVERS